MKTEKELCKDRVYGRGLPVCVILAIITDTFIANWIAYTPEMAFGMFLFLGWSVIWMWVLEAYFALLKKKL